MRQLDLLLQGPDGQRPRPNDPIVDIPWRCNSSNFICRHPAQGALLVKPRRGIPQRWQLAEGFSECGQIAKPAPGAVQPLSTEVLGVGESELLPPFLSDKHLRRAGQVGQQRRLFGM